MTDPESRFLQGTGSDTFVLQLSVTALTGDAYLGWFDTRLRSETYGQWINAVEGNTGASTPTFILGAYDPGAHFQLGYWGRDAATGSVWAVLDHNSDFAAVPEPSTYLLFAGGLLLLFVSRRRRA